MDEDRPVPHGGEERKVDARGLVRKPSPRLFWCNFRTCPCLDRSHVSFVYRGHLVTIETIYASLLYGWSFFSCFPPHASFHGFAPPEITLLSVCTPYESLQVDTACREGGGFKPCCASFLPDSARCQIPSPRGAGRGGEGDFDKRGVPLLHPQLAGISTHSYFPRSSSLLGSETFSPVLIAAPFLSSSRGRRRGLWARR
jgi:hypothetical protein